MKILFFSFVVFFFLLIIGCQENQITAPITTGEIEKASSFDETSTLGNIPLEGQLQDPNDPSNYFTINGMIQYEHKIIQRDPIPPVPQYYISVNLSVQATIKDDDLPVEVEGIVNSTSEDLVYVSEEGIYILEKYYEVSGLTNGMVLYLRFLVTTDGIGLNSMWLSVFDK